MFLKSKGFWICSIFTVCTVVFFGVVAHRSNQPQEVIKVYKAVEFSQHRTLQELAPSLRADSAGTETNTPVNTGSGNFSQDTETDTPEAFTAPADAFPAADVDTAQVSPPTTDTEVDAKAEAIADLIALGAKRLPELRIEIPRALEARLEVLELSEELITYVEEFGRTPEISELAYELNKERDELQKKIYGWCWDYILYSGVDGSAFEPGGEFFELMSQNGMDIDLVE